MSLPDPVHAVIGVPLLAIVPLTVELAKRLGMPVRFAGLAAIAISTLLLALASLALGEEVAVDIVARWALGGLVYGLAAAGVYSQRNVFGGPGQKDGEEPAAPRST